MIKYVAILIILFGCNPAKQVLKNKEQFEKIGKKWAEENPCVGDSTITYIPGQTDSIYYPVEIIRDSIHTEIDTITGDCSADIKKAYSKGYDKAISQFKQVKIPLPRVDTLKITVPDKRAENILREQVGTLTVQALTWKKAAQIRLWIAIGLGLLLILLVILLIKKK